MGLEVACEVELNDARSRGNAHCGDGLLEFKGDFRLRWKWSEITTCVAQDCLVATRQDQTAIFHLGVAAEKWDLAIKNPKSRLDKFGVKPGLCYTTWGVFDEAFAGELEQRAGRPGVEPFDIVFVRLNSLNDLDNLLDARHQIKQNGMVWAVWAKGRKELTENHVRDFALSNGLVDVKVASFNSELSSLKLVIPVALRT